MPITGRICIGIPFIVLIQAYEANNNWYTRTLHHRFTGDADIDDFDHNVISVTPVTV